MNEFERRKLEIAQNHVDFISVMRQMNANAVVEYFGYSLQIGSAASPLLNGVTQQGTIAIQANADFVMQYLITSVVHPDVLNIAATSLQVLLQITDTGNGDVLFNQPTPAGLVSGTPLGAMTGVPILMPVPRIIPSNTIVKVEATQMGVGGAGNLEPVGFYFSMLGARVSKV